MTKRWTPEEKATLQELYKLHAAPEIAQIMGKDVGAVYSAIARNKYKKDDDFFMGRQVLALCAISPGSTCAEIAHRLNKDYDNVSTAVRRMLKVGEIFRVGKGKNFVYYADQAAAEVAQAEALKKHAQHKEAMRLKKQEARRIAGRIKREKEAKALGKPTPRVLKPKLDIARIPRSNKPTAQPAEPVKVIWPESVKVQVIPTPPSRFAFEPTPGWRGQITHDWMDRRLSRASGNQSAN